MVAVLEDPWLQPFEVGELVVEQDAEDLVPLEVCAQGGPVVSATFDVGAVAGDAHHLGLEASASVLRWLQQR